MKQARRLLDGVRDDVEKTIIESRQMDSAPFEFISLMIRYGLKNDASPDTGRIHQSYRDLPLTIEIDLQSIMDKDEKSVQVFFTNVVLLCVIDAFAKYRLSTELLRLRMKESSA